MGYSAKEGMNRYRRKRRAQERSLIDRMSTITSHDHVAVHVTAPASEGGRRGLTALDEITEARCETCNLLMGLPV